MDMELDGKDVMEVPMHKRLKTSSEEFQHGSGSDTHTDTSSMSSVVSTGGGMTLLKQSGSLSLDRGSSDGRSTVTTVSPRSSESDRTGSDESSASSPRSPLRLDAESDEDDWPPKIPQAQTYRAAMLGLAYHNSKIMGEGYEYVSPVMSVPLYLGDDLGVHANFFARRKSDDDKDAKLFFVEKKNCPPVVTRCEILEPQPFSFGEVSPKPVDSEIFHPAGVVCLCGGDKRFDEGDAYSSSLLFYDYERTLAANALISGV